MKHTIFLTLAILISTVQTAQASCIEQTLEEQYEDADAVFVVTVEKIDFQNDVHLQINDRSVYKGAVQLRSFQIERPVGVQTSVDVQYVEGQQYLFFGKQDGDEWVTNNCDGTRALESVTTAELSELDTLRQKWTENGGSAVAIEFPPGMTDQPIAEPGLVPWLSQEVEIQLGVMIVVVAVMGIWIAVRSKK